jgi:hypothetical protein
MANVIIKTDERRAQEAYVLHAFRKGQGGTNVTRCDRDAAECIAARQQDAFKELRKMEGKRR